ncbi:nuclear transport factor 2 family protein [Croceicoccus sp. F390]|uniref:Nuclear transport factor 2 family protein n=1 Tax=Croceicoccus esteveae TaxID=3075597 RepID=A0ABU2ZEW4_9SPHN|nr:nuclear transport factor 2 family protein [Croceicoccus sp. F390]MDT0574935.1 nuclear transport factor 2 family protein [Croceicoccus sp. F390]
MLSPPAALSVAVVAGVGRARLLIQSLVNCAARPIDRIDKADSQAMIIAMACATPLGGLCMADPNSFGNRAESGDLQPLLTRMQALEDREEIRNLIAGYGPLVDSGNAAGAADMWTDDGSYAVGGMGLHSGRAAVETILDSAGHHDLIGSGAAHLLGPVKIVLDGDSASATGLSIVFRHQADGFAAWRVSANRWALVRTDAGWRVQHRDNRLLDGDPAARALLAGDPETS